ncbi:MAG: TipAS antibiotic-recognition domain-containing protein [Patescibacteria group bacterium]|jgi:hypothetical protein
MTDNKEPELNPYDNEARERWGNTQFYQQSQKRVKALGEDGLGEVIRKSQELIQKIAGAMKKGKTAQSEAVQKLIDRHYNALNAFYDPTLGLYRGLAETYISDERFKENYEKVAVGLAQFMHDAMIYYVDTKETE